MTSQMYTSSVPVFKQLLTALKLILTQAALPRHGFHTRMWTGYALAGGASS
jgi:hypothetical protein